MRAFGFVSLLVLAVVGMYYATTFSVWLGHWLSHRRHSPTRAFHMDGHHTIYPDSQHCRSTGTSYQSGKNGTNSAFALLPTLTGQALLLYLVLPWQWLAVCFGEMCVLLVVLNILHEQFHVDRSFLERYAWFARARASHYMHHDAPLNFMVVDHLWDRLFGTFRLP